MQLKFGIISNLDAAKGLARVTFPQDDNLVTKWLPMAVPKSKEDKFSIPFDINEHVYCIMDDDCEDGVIAGAIYDAKNVPSVTGTGNMGVLFVPNMCVKYNRQTQTLSVTGDGIVEIDVTGEVKIKAQTVTIESLTKMDLKAATEINLDAPMVKASAAMQVAAVMTAGAIAASASAVGGADGSATIGGNITVTGIIDGGTVKQGTVELGTHTHSGVSTGAGISGPPTP